MTFRYNAALLANARNKAFVIDNSLEGLLVQGKGAVGITFTSAATSTSTSSKAVTTTAASSASSVKSGSVGRRRSIFASSRSTSSSTEDNSCTSEEDPYPVLEYIGQGTFGTVYRTCCPTTKEFVAVKKVVQNPDFKLRELEIMKRLQEFPHPYIVQLRDNFYTSTTGTSNGRGGRNGNSSVKSEIYLNLVMEFIPQTLASVIAQAVSSHRPSSATTGALTTFSSALSPLQVRIFAFQLFRGLAHLHGLGISHRDIKPQNILVDVNRNIVKICDFGSAKMLRDNESNVAYICSRYYRAPELIIAGRNYVPYSHSIDVWSAGCVLAEMILGRPLFPGISACDQLIEIAKVLGAPNAFQMVCMDPDNMATMMFPGIRGKGLSSILGGSACDHDLIGLLKDMLDYNPQMRSQMIDCCAHPYFSSIRKQIQHLLDDGTVAMDICTFDDEELQCASPQTLEILTEFATLARTTFYRQDLPPSASSQRNSYTTSPLRSPN